MMSATDEDHAEGNGEDVDLEEDLIFVSEERIDTEETSNAYDGEGGEGDGEEYYQQNEEEAYQEEDNEGFDISGVEDDAKIDGEEHGEGDEEHGDKEDKANSKDGALMIVDEWDEEVESDLEDEGFGAEPDETVINPEIKEKLILSMPSHKTLLADIGHLKQNRRVIVEPLTLEELKHDKLYELALTESCTEFKTHFLKSSEDETTWKGIAILHFTTCGSATNAVESLKEIRSDLNVKVDTNTTQAMEQFSKNTRNEKRWPDNVVLIRHVVNEESKLEAVTEFLKQQCPDAEQIIIHPEHSKSRSGSSKDKEKDKDKDKEKEKEKSSSVAKDEKASTTATSSSSNSPPRGFAYLVFVTRKAAEAAVEDFDSRVVEYEGHRLIAQIYDMPADTVPRGLLKLRERRVLLNHVEKLSAKIEKAKTDPASVKLPEKAEDRVKKCKELIDRDSRARKEVNLSSPTLEELRAMQGLPVMTATDSQRLLVHLGVIRSRKPEPKPKEGRRDSHRRGSSRSRQDRGSRYTRRSPPRRSQRGSWSGNRNQRSGGGGGSRMMNNSNAGGLGIGGVNPLAQLMLQQNLGMLGGAGLNPVNLMMQPGANLLASANLLANQRAAGLGGSGMGYGGGSDERPNKVLRLDETGNFREGDSRYGADDYGRGGRHSRDDFYERDNRGRNRSRSPHYDRGGQRGLDTYGRSSPPRRGGAGVDGGQENSVNLLLNLSQMLSQKIEQKRGTLDRDRHGYDRDYGGRR